MTKLFDGIERMITLATGRVSLIAKEIKDVYRNKATPLQRFQQLVGKSRPHFVLYSKEKGFIYSTSFSCEG